MNQLQEKINKDVEAAKIFLTEAPAARVALTYDDTPLEEMKQIDGWREAVIVDINGKPMAKISYEVPTPQRRIDICIWSKELNPIETPPILEIVSELLPPKE